MQFKKLLTNLILSTVSLTSTVYARDITMLTAKWAPLYGSGSIEQDLITAMTPPTCRHRHRGQR
jgi:hypothetical protein